MGKSGYKAYVGDVNKGVVSGQGTLYNKTGNIVYEGAFEANAYNGTGKQYYENTNLRYEGEFKDNLFQGEGNLYTENGTIKYIGAFHHGKMDGKGQLYNEGGNKIYTGTFQQDRILYTEMLGKETNEVSQMYTGERKIYQTQEKSCVIMNEIGAAYCAQSGENSLDEEWKVTGVYVFSDNIYINGHLVENISDAIELLGKPEYEGNTAVSAEDAVIVNAICDLQKTNQILFGKVKMETNQILDEVVEVEKYDQNYLVYIYRFQEEDRVYTFFCREKNEGFDFYLLEE